MNVLIAEYKCDDNILAKITNSITKTGYCHSGMVIETNGGLFYCELDAFNKPQYHIRNIDSVQKLMDSDRRIELYKIPASFTNEQAEAGIRWWFDRRTWAYGFFKLISFLWIAPMNEAFKMYYRATGKVFEPIMGNAIKKQLVCSGSVDKCMKEAFGYDSFKDLDEDCVFPGLWARDSRFQRVGV